MGAQLGSFGGCRAWLTSLSRPDGLDHLSDAKDVQGSTQIVGERGQAELGADFFEPLHQKRALIHPLLDRAKGMLDDLATPKENVGPFLQSGGHAIERRLVLQTRDFPKVVCAARAQWTDGACWPAAGSVDTKIGCFVKPEVCNAKAQVQ